MGTKRIGLARMEALMENLKRELAMGAGSEMILDTISLSEAGTAVFTTQVATVTTAAITVTAGAHTNATFAQPAGTSIKELILIPQGIITTGNNGSDELDFGLGTSTAANQILAQKALLDGADESVPANHALHVISGGRSTMVAASPFAAIIASEASPLVTTTYSAGARTLHVRFTPINQNLAATAAVKIIAIFQKH